jgi:hypothetical protein
LCTQTNNTMNAKLNTNLFPIISVAMYGTYLDPDSMFDSYMIESDKEEGYIHFGLDYFWDNFQSDKYKLAIQERAHSFINGKIKEGDVWIYIKAGEIYSPKYYNFSNDEMDLDVTFSKKDVLNSVNNDIQKFDEFLKERYSSRDGFNSFTSNNYNDWLEDFNDEKDTAIGAVLTYLFQETIEENREAFIQHVCDDYMDYREFVDYEKHDKDVIVLRKYVEDNYNTIDIDSIDTEMFELEMLEDENEIKKLLREFVLQIDNKTLSMF